VLSAASLKNEHEGRRVRQSRQTGRVKRRGGGNSNFLPSGKKKGTEDTQRIRLIRGPFRGKEKRTKKPEGKFQPGKVPGATKDRKNMGGRSQNKKKRHQRERD